MWWPLTEHPDPQWWKRCRVVEAFHRQAHDVDLCEYCGHVRALHTRASGCSARSTSMVGNPRPCTCTNSSAGTIYRDSSTLSSVQAK